MNKLKDFKLLYKDFEPLFENDFSNISDDKDLDFDNIIDGFKPDWYKTDFYYKLMNWIFIRKKLDCAIFDLKMKIDDVKIKNKILENQLQIIKKFGSNEAQDEIKKESLRCLKIDLCKSLSSKKDLGFLKREGQEKS